MTMDASARPVSPSERANLVLAEIVEEVTNKFHGGEAVDVEEYSRAHPELAEQLRQLLPALHVLADLRHSTSSVDAVVPSAPVPVSAAELGELGDFRIFREIGRGGMGIVYEAEQISLRRRVALKVLPLAAALDPKHLQRFKNEAQAAGHLQHTNIVPVYYVGCERGAHFYAMQYIEGQTLAAIIRELRQLDRSETARPASAAGAASSLASKLASGHWAPIKQPGGEQPTGPYLITPPAHDATTSPSVDQTPVVAALSTERSTKSVGFFRTVAHLGVQAAEALEHAHQLGVVHRDIKPANLLVDGRGNLWITDFGLAHFQNQAGLTLSGDLIGTLRYMSPEQALAKRPFIDHRTDIYSLGVTLYELLAQEPAFKGTDREELLQQIAFQEPPPPRQWNKAIPRELETIVLKAMEKGLETRYATAQELADDLRRFLEDRPIQAKRPTLLQRAAKWARRHKTMVRATAVVLGLAVLALAVSTLLIGRAQQRMQQEQWMREVVIPTLRHLVGQKNYRAAFELAEKAEQAIADDPTLAELRPQFTSIWTVATDPPGADVYAKSYDRPQDEWQYLGHSPLDQVRLPRGFFRWRVTKQGFAPVEGFPEAVRGRIQFTLDPEGSLPPGMVRVSGNAYRENPYGLDALNALDLEDYLIDRCEVTNRQYKEFMDQGGYRERKYWKQPFHDHQTALAGLGGSTIGLLESPLRQGPVLTAGALFPGRIDQTVLCREDAMKRFHDQTGKLGPSTWRSGSYPGGEDNYPVAGVSWYEAAAYAEFAGKSLPTVAHWVRATGYQHAVAMIPLSNFGRSGPAPVGTSNGLGPFGTLDMAGNVKEWCWNQSQGDRHFLLGGAWNEPDYLFTQPDTSTAFDRSPANGFRCVHYLSDKIPTRAREAMLPSEHRDYEKEKPASDEVFQLIKTLYAYEKPPLNSHLESKPEVSAESIHEIITFDAAYGKERVIAHLYLPRQGKPPYQAVIFFPWSNYWEQRSFPRENPPDPIAFIVRSGRAVLWPVYKGSCERWEQDPWTNGWGVRSSWNICCHQDLARSVDYLQERSDIDRDRLAFYDVSSMGPGIRSLAMEDRFKVAVLIACGLPPFRIPRPEIDLINFAPRVRVPVLMINSRNDPIGPLQTSQLPLYRLLGTPPDEKRHRAYDVAGHGIPLDMYKKEMFSWLDQYLGKVP
jgi:serine/threonine protein kinase/formylglycine-generating enzyme required for sulfatase activity